MPQIIYTMHFRGTASRSPGNESRLRITTSGTSCTLQTVVSPSGAHTTLHAGEGDLAFIEAEIRLKGHEIFEGNGVLTFGEEGEHALRFSSSHPGTLKPGVIPGVVAGTMSWSVNGGTGRFADASGLLTSLFTLTEEGELSEYQWGLVFLPG